MEGIDIVATLSEAVWLRRPHIWILADERPSQQMKTRLRATNLTGSV
jgi:hypothetical protein